MRQSRRKNGVYPARLIPGRSMTQQPDNFTRREVERSFRKFHDIVDDLMAAKFQTWGDTFSQLVAHCGGIASSRLFNQHHR